jgi:hypothetical protein
MQVSASRAGRYERRARAAVVGDSDDDVVRALALLIEWCR